MELSFESLETPALTKAQLADLLFEQIGLNKRESKFAPKLQGPDAIRAQENRFPSRHDVP